jgi:hypothetical protein
MPAERADDEFRKLIDESGLPWKTEPTNYRVELPWATMSGAAASIIEQHVPVGYETVAGEFRARCTCGMQGVDIETPHAWALHVANLIFRAPS